MYTKNYIRIHYNYIIKLFFLFLFYSSHLTSQEPKEFNSISDLLNYVDKKNTLLTNLDLDKKIARINKNSSIANIFNFKVPLISQFNYNPIKQVGLFPAIFFGGKVGEFVETPTSPQYNFTVFIQPEIEVVNFAAISQAKLSRISEKLVETKSNLTKQSLYEEINNCYFNVLLLKEQKNIFNEILLNIKKIKEIAANKHKEGLIRKQDLYDAENAVLLVENNIKEAEIELEKQQLFLNLFAENEINLLLNEKLISYENESYLSEITNNLPVESIKIQLDYGKTEHKLSKNLTLPVVSFFTNFGFQNASSEYFFNENSRWLNNQNIGLKLSWNLPVNFTTFSNISTKRIQTEVLKNKLSHQEKENELTKKHILLDYKKHIENSKNFKKIYLLKQDILKKIENQYLENFTSLDKLLFSLNESMNSKLSFINSLSKIGWLKNKILILNKF